MSDTLGDYLKGLEPKSVFDPTKYLYMRIDGRGFSKLTREYTKPYSKHFMDEMQNTTEAVMREFSADIAFQQSDEISLLWFPVQNSEQERIFGSKQHKLISLVPAFASNWLGFRLDKLLCFDARAYECDYFDAVKSLYWRHRDCVKNAITMVAQDIFSHKQLNGINTDVRLQMIADTDMWARSPKEFKYGYWLGRSTKKLPMPDHVPEQYRNSELVERSVVEQIKVELSFNTLRDFSVFIEDYMVK